MLEMVMSASYAKGLGLSAGNGLLLWIIGNNRGDTSTRVIRSKAHLRYYASSALGQFSLSRMLLTLTDASGWNDSNNAAKSV